MSRWSFKLEREIFDSMEIVAAGHMDMKEIILDTNRGVYRAIVGFDVYGFLALTDLMIHYFICEA